MSGGADPKHTCLKLSSSSTKKGTKASDSAFTSAQLFEVLEGAERQSNHEITSNLAKVALEEYTSAAAKKGWLDNVIRKYKTNKIHQVMDPLQGSRVVALCKALESTGDHVKWLHQSGKVHCL